MGYCRCEPRAWRTLFGSQRSRWGPVWGRRRSTFDSYNLSFGRSFDWFYTPPPFIQIAQFDTHEMQLPHSIIDRFQSDPLSTPRQIQINLLPFPFDLSVMAHCSHWPIIRILWLY